MATLEKIKDEIIQIAERPNNVTSAELKWVVEQLKQHGFKVRGPRHTRHGELYGIGSYRFQICTHNPGSRHVKRCYVDDFLRTMNELGLYEN